ncbi:hypothetical protein P1J78_04270 [Psychromarinibacter sp. C21-152]|uniref:DUF3592 domain-containing protein n=1 Tax=Psychromarinibacter sediminicola TaxID=3033385 RepID=A0AAE3NQR8_9RHOB|nr:DUF3592 domain-containing protein [Psychromarinibacter sediminicola]MDF0599939.1 hypothetical protein [Psychromarinibacter sediminicola]
MGAYRRRHDRHRPRGWWSLFIRLGGWVGLILGALLLVVTTFSAGALFLADRLDRSGALAYAVVTDTREAPSAEGTEHYVTFTFKAKGGGGRTVETAVSPGYYADARIGDERPIRYLLDDPTQVEEDLGAYRRVGTRLRWIGLAVGLAGLAALWVFGKRANRAVRVRRDGRRVLADVMGVRELRVTVNGARQGRLTWREPDGKTGESLMRPVAWLRETYRPGDRIVVYRLGRHAYWEGDVGPPRHALDSG